MKKQWRKPELTPIIWDDEEPWKAAYTPHDNLTRYATSDWLRIFRANFPIEPR